METSPDGRPVVLFDGVCNLCNGVVNFLLDHDPEGQLRFGALQSEAGKRILGQHTVSIEPDDLETIVFIEPAKDGESKPRVSVRSDVALRIAGYLSKPWRWLHFLRFIPRLIRNAAYANIARNRYRWFGRRDTCRMPTPEEANRFIDQESPSF